MDGYLAARCDIQYALGVDNFLIFRKVPSIEGPSSGSLLAMRAGSLDQGFDKNFPEVSFLETGKVFMGW
ncbi:hypothetical protein [uncultured Celeribacter sp.]|uniref:hypothetical protein n=1 Tax=uncultured Celeribacter sp. TaxID=1303376 RepID=UPI003748F996